MDCCADYDLRCKLGQGGYKSCAGQFKAVGFCGGTDMFCDKDNGYFCKACPTGTKNCNRSQYCETKGACPADGGDLGGVSGGTAGSCAGRCGSPDKAPGGSCYCDAACITNNDCCPDYPQTCQQSQGGGGAKSCAGNFQTVGYCGGTDMYCDKEGGYVCKPCPTGTSNCNRSQVCETSGSCDSGADTNGGSSGAGPITGTCAGHCGNTSKAPGADCYCDSFCTVNGDCCPDYPQLCEQTQSGDGNGNGSTTGSCAGHCGSPDKVPGGDCYCDATCSKYGDCCSDHSLLCS
jgi:hypothetical protein